MKFRSRPENPSRPDTRTTPARSPEAGYSLDGERRLATDLEYELRHRHADLRRGGDWPRRVGYDDAPALQYIDEHLSDLHAILQTIYPSLAGADPDRLDEAAQRAVVAVDSRLQRRYCLDDLVKVIPRFTDQDWKRRGDDVRQRITALEDGTYYALQPEEKEWVAQRIAEPYVTAFSAGGPTHPRVEAYSGLTRLVGYPQQDLRSAHGHMAVHAFTTAYDGALPDPETLWQLRGHTEALLSALLQPGGNGVRKSLSEASLVTRNVAERMQAAYEDIRKTKGNGTSAIATNLRYVALASGYRLDDTPVAPADGRQTRSQPAAPRPEPRRESEPPRPHDPYGPASIDSVVQPSGTAREVPLAELRKAWAGPVRRTAVAASLAAATVAGLGAVSASPAAAAETPSASTTHEGRGARRVARTAPAPVVVAPAPEVSPDDSRASAGSRGSTRASQRLDAAAAAAARERGARRAPVAEAPGSVEAVQAAVRRLEEQMRFQLSNPTSTTTEVVGTLAEIWQLRGILDTSPRDNVTTRLFANERYQRALDALDPTSTDHPNAARETAAVAILLARYPDVMNAPGNAEMVKAYETFRSTNDTEKQLFEFYYKTRYSETAKLLFGEQPPSDYSNANQATLVRLLTLADFYTLDEAARLPWLNKYTAAQQQAEAERVAEEERVRQEALAAQRAQEEAARSQEQREQQTLSVGHIFPEGTQYVRTSEFGPRWGTMHRGEDLAVDPGTPVLAPARARVVRMVPDGQSSRSSRASHGSTGNVMVLQFEASHPEYPGAYVGVDFAHLNGFAEGLKEGDIVERGQVVAYSGNTGRSTGPHVHINYVMIESGNENDFRWSRDTYDPDVMYEKFGNGVTL